MNVIVAVVLLLGTTHCRVYYDDLPSWPKFDKEIVKRINILHLTDDLCHVNGALVAEQTNCRQCTQNVSSVMAANDGVHAYIGTKSILISVDLERCQTQVYPWLGGSSGNCAPAWQCSNYLSRIIPLGDDIAVCGTNFGNPEVMRLEGSALTEITSDLKNLCSPFPTWEVSHLSVEYTDTTDTKTQAVFVGSNKDMEHVFITKYTLNTNTRKVQITSKDSVTTHKSWLNKAEFLTSFESRDFVYFVMRELTHTGYEVSVARICKSDPGFIPQDQPANSDRIFFTFTKSKLSCEMPLSDKTLNFNIITAASYNKDTEILYGAFTEYFDLDIGGYAMCSYTLQEIDNSFEGEYYYHDRMGALQKQFLNTPISCSKFRDSSQAYKYYWTATVIKQQTPYPLYYELKRFTSLLTEHVRGHTVVYIGTDTGSIEKLVVVGTKEEPKVFYAAEFIAGAPHSVIKSLQFTKSAKKDMISSTEHSVSKYPTHQCETYSDLEDCITLRDPHCCWCKTSHKCSHYSTCAAEQCVNDPETGSVLQAFEHGLVSYQWKRDGACEPDCNSVEDSCSKGLRIQQVYQVVPTVTLQSEDVLDCVYTGPWIKKVDYDNNTTNSVTQQVKKEKGSNEAMLGGNNRGMLFKVLAGVFGTLVVALLCINVYLMCDRAHRDTGNNLKNNLYIPSQKNNEENPANIHPTKALSYLPSGPPPEQLPMIQSHRHDQHQHLQIMPQHINAPITNSPYHGQITETDEGLMELRPDMQQPMYGGAFSKTLPRRLHEHQHELAPPQKFHTMQRGMTGIPPGYNPQMYQPHQYMP